MSTKIYSTTLQQPQKLRKMWWWTWTQGIDRGLLPPQIMLSRGISPENFWQHTIQYDERFAPEN